MTYHLQWIGIRGFYSRQHPSAAFHLTWGPHIFHIVVFSLLAFLHFLQCHNSHSQRLCDCDCDGCENEHENEKNNEGMLTFSRGFSLIMLMIAGVLFMFIAIPSIPTIITHGVFLGLISLSV